MFPVLIGLRPLDFIAGARQELKTFPVEVQHDIGRALMAVQSGFKPRNAKPLKGFGGASVLEIIEDHRGSTYRVIYTIRFGKIIYVLHCFQKKSKKGISTPKQNLDLIRKRLSRAEEAYKREK